MIKYISLFFLKSVVCNVLKVILCFIIRCYVGWENWFVVNSRWVCVLLCVDELLGLCY